MIVRLASTILLIVSILIAVAGESRAGHEITFYPSFYPQEITVQTMDGAAAARRLAKSTAQAYLGDPFARGPVPDEHVQVPVAR